MSIRSMICATSASLVLFSVAGLASAQCSSSAKAESCGEKKAQVTTASMGMMNATSDIVDTAVAAGNFKTLAAALQAAGLVDALKGKGPFTVFAPSDEAFAKLPKETVESLLKPEGKELLTKILTYHVVGGSRIFSDAAAKGANVSTVQGQEIKTMSKDGKVFVNNATVTTADIDAKNGVIHVIDTVLMPK